MGSTDIAVLLLCPVALLVSFQILYRTVSYKKFRVYSQGDDLRVGLFQFHRLSVNGVWAHPKSVLCTSMKWKADEDGLVQVDLEFKQRPAWLIVMDDPYRRMNNE